ncbi:hypothetical protein [Pedococcus bigeumensis]|uniref:Uncharacterized protein n=1 Tax=Pedococcus bigeumensis TaxID=433644 RepID=A0A502D2I9_9MICO|nr:hypothetical protein [Pedococcus bigeumensis]TPG18306.1 hypothetical protein EAH86_08040 [Pedococcus bigeumensis]
MGQTGTVVPQQGLRVLPLALGVGVLGSAAVVAWTCTQPEALPASPVLVVPAVLLLLAGQVGVAGRLRLTSRARSRVSVGRLARAFASPGGAALALIAVAGLLAAWSGLRLAPGGTPADARPGCPYPLVSRGHVLCVSPEHYRLAGLGAERFAAGVVLLLLAVDLAVALAPAETRQLA